MSTRLQNHQPDLLHRAAVDAERKRLPPDIQTTVVSLLKQLLSECLLGGVKTRQVDE
jgi:hypothetical protein